MSEEILDNQVQSTETPVVTETVTPTVAETFEIKHNKEVKQVTKDELLTLAQKGLDYDRIRPAHDYVKQLAGGVDVKEFLEKAKSTPVTVDLSADETAIAQKVFDDVYRELVDEGNTDAVAKRLAAIEANSKKQEIIAQKRSQAEKTQQTFTKQLEQIFKENADYKGELPDEVLEEMANIQAQGLATNPYAAHKLYLSNHAQENAKKEIEALKAKVEALTGNAANSAATTGNLGSGVAADKDYYTSEEWDKLPLDMRIAMTKSGKADKIMSKWKK